MVSYTLGRRTVEITHPDRVLFPDDGYTKADLARYHHAVAAALVAHRADRPLMLQRFPEGIGGKGFYQKEGGRGVPRWIRKPCGCSNRTFNRLTPPSSSAARRSPRIRPTHI